MTRSTPFVILAAVLMTSVQAMASLVTFNMHSIDSGATSVSSADFGSTAANIDDVVLTTGSGLTRVAYSNAFGHRESNGNPVDATLADAKANNAYFTFTVSPDASYEITFTSMDLKFSMQDADDTNGTLVIEATVGAVTTSIFTSSLATHVSPGDAFGGIDLSALGTVSSDVEFRIYAFGGNSGYAQRGIGSAFNSGDTGDDLVINGSVSPVPEPASIGLFAAGLLAVGMRRWKA